MSYRPDEAQLKRDFYLLLKKNSPKRLSYDEVIAPLRIARVQAGLTQTEVAIRMGVTQAAVARIESGKHNVSLRKLIQYTESLDLVLQINTVNRSIPGEDIFLENLPF